MAGWIRISFYLDIRKDISADSITTTSQGECFVQEALGCIIIEKKKKKRDRLVVDGLYQTSQKKKK